MFFGSLLGVELEIISPPLCIMIAMTAVLSYSTKILIREYKKRVLKKTEDIILLPESGGKEFSNETIRPRSRSITEAFDSSSLELDESLEDLDKSN